MYTNTPRSKASFPVHSFLSLPRHTCTSDISPPATAKTLLLKKDSFTWWRHAVGFRRLSNQSNTQRQTDSLSLHRKTSTFSGLIIGQSNTAYVSIWSSQNKRLPGHSNSLALFYLFCLPQTAPVRTKNSFANRTNGSKLDNGKLLSFAFCPPQPAPGWRIYLLTT